MNKRIIAITFASAISALLFAGCGFMFAYALMFIKPKDTSKEDAHRREVEKIVKEVMAEEEKCDVATINK